MTVLGSGTSLSIRWYAIDSDVSPVNGVAPVSISYSSTPAA